MCRKEWKEKICKIPRPCCDECTMTKQACKQYYVKFHFVNLEFEYFRSNFLSAKAISPRTTWYCFMGLWIETITVTDRKQQTLFFLFTFFISQKPNTYRIKIPVHVNDINKVYIAYVITSYEIYRERNVSIYQAKSLC